MIDRTTCVTLARYNSWQNRQLREAVEGLTEADLIRDRGAHFGSILGTLNHLLWGDQIWMSRFDGGAGPGIPLAESPSLCARADLWATERFRTDARIMLWAEGLTAVELAGSMSWHSGATGRDVTRPVALCVLHMFNHQTHHRGQVHALLTAAGARAPVTDLCFMSESDGRL
ncbi:DinB family protein [Litorisediminicola beolgyonensis]|uniref:DinB family protein n=1 Tax=Litorisediminicola beolgyonensis TaxID=1173614 RepID=A0ABW3ZF91_9RHOB